MNVGFLTKNIPMGHIDLMEYTNSIPSNLSSLLSQYPIDYG